MTNRIACAQIRLSIGDTEGNRATARAAIEAAARDGAQIVVLPELASSGYVFADRAELSSLAGAGTNRLPIAVCDRVGVERGQDWIGGSVIVDADGYPLAIAEFGRAGLVAADVDIAGSRVKRINAHNDVHGDRRTDLYRRTALLD